jgi:hypothetical protein
MKSEESNTTHSPSSGGVMNEIVASLEDAAYGFCADHCTRLDFES